MSIRTDARFRLLYDLGCAFAARIDLDELVPLVIERCREVFDAEGASVLLLDENENSLFFPYAIGRDEQITQRLRSLRFPAGEGLAGRVLRSGAPEKVDEAGDDRLFREIDRLTGTVTRNLIAAPLRTRQRGVGVLEVINRHDGGFSDDDLAFLAALAGGVAVALENATLYARVKESEELLRAEVGALRRDLERRERFEEIVGSGEAMAEVFRLLESAAASPISVLVEGETGTGKELIARSIHRAGDRASGPFIAVNCAALPESLLESELFGHKRGSFTGALQDRRGLFEAAGGGTIFLDEVGEMPPVMQAKLLRVLQEGEIVPVGETRPRRIDVRVISATNRDLRTEVEERRFREDLYYRLAQFPIWIPPLRERSEDVPPIADRLLGAAARRHRKRIPGIEPDAMAALIAYSWPGNVRQLQNEITRAVALAADGEHVGVRHLSSLVLGRPARSGAVLPPAGPPRPAPAPAAEPSPTVASSPAEPPPPTDPLPAATPPTDLRAARESFEIAFVIETLRREGGNVTRAARALGLSRVMLQRKMKHHGLR